MENKFKKASKAKLRFDTSRGVLSTEDLWDLSLEDLDVLAKKFNKAVKDSAEESFIADKSTKNTTAELKFDLVKHIIDVKLAQKEANRTAAERRAKKAQILELINAKENEALGAKSVEDLRKELEEL